MFSIKSVSLILISLLTTASAASAQANPPFAEVTVNEQNQVKIKFLSPNKARDENGVEIPLGKMHIVYGYEEDLPCFETKFLREYQCFPQFSEQTRKARGSVFNIFINETNRLDPSGFILGKGIVGLETRSWDVFNETPEEYDEKKPNLPPIGIRFKYTPEE